MTTERGGLDAQVSDEEVLEKFPSTRLDHDSKVFYKGLLRQQILVNRCQDCGHWHFPLEPICPECWSERVVATAISGKGTIYQFVLLHQGTGAPMANDAAPYPGVNVELAEQPGLKLQTTIVNCPSDALYIGMPVELTWIERQGVPVPAFQPAPGALKE